MKQEGNFNKKKDKHKIDFEKIRINLNSNLPEDVRVFAIKLVTNQFDVRR